MQAHRRHRQVLLATLLLYLEPRDEFVYFILHRREADHRVKLIYGRLRRAGRLLVRHP
jgi:hypothetical protein